MVHILENKSCRAPLIKCGRVGSDLVQDLTPCCPGHWADCAKTWQVFYPYGYQATEIIWAYWTPTPWPERPQGDSGGTCSFNRVFLGKLYKTQDVGCLWISGEGLGQIRSRTSPRCPAVIQSAWGRFAAVVPWAIGLKFGWHVTIIRTWPKIYFGPAASTPWPDCCGKRVRALKWLLPGVIP